MTENNFLIYGLKDERHNYYCEKIKENQDLENESLFIDKYNALLSLILYRQWGKIKYNKEYNINETTIWDSEESFLKFVKETSGSLKFLEKYREDGRKYPLWETYFEQLQKQPPMKTLPVIYKDILKKAQEGDFYSSMSLPNEYLYTIRGCKIGLQLASIRDDLFIHFVLDEMDFEDVVSKNEDGYGTSVTSKELRYIYRNWEELKGKVIFIENGKKVPAPWEQNPALWKKYKPKSRQQAEAPELSKVKLEDVIGRFQESKLTVVDSNEKIVTYIPKLEDVIGRFQESKLTVVDSNEKTVTYIPKKQKVGFISY